MQGNRLSEHIISNTSHLDGLWREELSSIHKTASRESYWVVSLVHNEHSNDSLVTIDNKVSTKLVHVFLLRDELLLSHFTQVTVLRSYHHWNFADANIDLLWVLVVDSATESCVEGCLICQRPHTALSWVDLLLLAIVTHE